MLDRLADLNKFAEVRKFELCESGLLFKQGSHYIRTKESNVDEEAAIAHDDGGFMTDFFKEVEQIQLSLRKIEKDTDILQDNYNERLTKVNPSERKSNYPYYFHFTNPSYKKPSCGFRTQFRPCDCFFRLCINAITYI